MARKRTRREFLKVAGAAGLALGAAPLVSCGRQGRRGEVEITFTHAPDETGVFREQVSAFNSQHAGEVAVRYREMPADTGQYFDLIGTELRAGKADADVISGDVIWPAELAASGWIQDLSDLFPDRSELLSGAVRSATLRDGLYGVPWFTDAGMMFCRGDLLERSGFSEPPKTWNELAEQATKVMRDADIRHGLVFQGAEYEGGVVNGLEFIWNAGGEVLDGGEVLVTEPGAVEGLRIERGTVEDGVSPQAVSSYKELESYLIFLRGAAVFMRNWPFALSIASDPRQSDLSPSQISVSPLPTADPGATSYSGLGGWNLMLNASTEGAEREAAGTFIRYMTSPERQKERALKGGYLPTREALYEDREILSTVPVISLGKEAIGNVRSRPVSPSYSEMSLAMATRFNALLTGESSPQETADRLGAELGSITG
jgi:multiple sugar transport system substrate-binding protein